MIWFWRVLCLLAGGVFIYAGALKIWDPLGFAGDILNYRIVPWSLAIRLALYLPWLEVICGLAVIAGLFRGGALTILSALMVGFIGATIAAKARGLDASCGCFGAASKNLTFTWHLLLDFAILAALLALWFRTRTLRADEVPAVVGAIAPAR